MLNKYIEEGYSNFSMTIILNKKFSLTVKTLFHSEIFTL